MGKKSGIKRREVGVMTQEEVAQELGLSRAMVGKTERDAILKIKKILKSKNLKKEDLI
jgi:transcriptional regulator with XRE-family HTH domain